MKNEVFVILKRYLMRNSQMLLCGGRVKQALVHFDEHLMLCLTCNLISAPEFLLHKAANREKV